MKGNNRKLALKKESLRKLTARELHEHVVGGIPIDPNSVRTGWTK